MYTYQPELYHTTYEYESKPLYPQNYILDKTKETLYQTGMDRKSNSPPIILCETGGSRNAKAHKHRYLFYPSASRLSPFSDNYNINTYAKNSINYKDDNKNEKSPEKYQAMYDKSFELVKKISELVPEKEAKIKGNSDYYLNKDKDYMNIIDNQINTLTNHFQKSNFNLGYKTDGMLLQNSNINNSNDINNNTYGIYKNNILERINNSKNNTNNQKAFDINSKNRNYINSTIGKIKFLLSEDDNVVGKLNAILKNVKDQNKIGKIDKSIRLVESLYKLPNLKVFDQEKSIYQPRGKYSRDYNQTLDELGLDDFQLDDEFMSQFRVKYDESEIFKFLTANTINGIFKASNVINENCSDGEFLMAVYCVIYAVERDYDVNILSDVLETKTYVIRDFEISQKKGK
jgi:hypothetical protein